LNQPETSNERFDISVGPSVAVLMDFQAVEGMVSVDTVVMEIEERLG
jgi:hypothetical protein